MPLSIFDVFQDCGSRILKPSIYRLLVLLPNEHFIIGHCILRSVVVGVHDFHNDFCTSLTTWHNQQTQKPDTVAWSPGSPSISGRSPAWDWTRPYTFLGLPYIMQSAFFLSSSSSMVFSLPTTRTQAGSAFTYLWMIYSRSCWHLYVTLNMAWVAGTKAA